MQKKTVIRVPKIFKRDRLMAVIVAAKREAHEELKQLRARDKSERAATRKK